MKAIDLKEIEGMREEYLQDNQARILRNALTLNDISKISRVFDGKRNNPNLFSVDLKTMKVTNQMQSGRCWIFSSMNVLREIIAKKYEIEDFELSQNFIAFYDKLEKCNFFMEATLAEIDAPLDSEVMRWLLQMPINDGGQWDMITSIVKKYGICPKSAMPETYQSSHTRAMNGILIKRLRKFVIDSRKLKEEGKDDEIAALKEECLKECYSLIVSCFGLPPETFTFEYYDKDKKYHAYRDVTPKQFYEEYLGVDLDEYVGIIHGPTADKPYHHMYTVKYLGNVVDGDPISFLNLPMEEFKEAVKAQLKDEEPVWFGCDCGKDGDRESGLWDDGQFDYENTLNMNLSMTKAEMLDSGESAMNHAMVFTGVNLVDDKPTRWKIENSWGEKVADKGYYTCSDSWFDLYVYEAVVHKKYLPEDVLKVLDEEPKVLNPWDPFGSLAD